MRFGSDVRGTGTIAKPTRSGSANPLPTPLLDRGFFVLQHFRPESLSTLTLLKILSRLNTHIAQECFLLNYIDKMAAMLRIWAGVHAFQRVAAILDRSLDERLRLLYKIMQSGVNGSGAPGIIPLKQRA
jgi:hypothetical protein